MYYWHGDYGDMGIQHHLLPQEEQGADTIHHNTNDTTTEGNLDAAQDGTHAEHDDVHGSAWSRTPALRGHTLRQL